MFLRSGTEADGPGMVAKNSPPGPAIFDCRFGSKSDTGPRLRCGDEVARHTACQDSGVDAYRPRTVSAPKVSKVPRPNGVTTATVTYRPPASLLETFCSVGGWMVR